MVCDNILSAPRAPRDACIHKQYSLYSESHGTVM